MSTMAFATRDSTTMLRRNVRRMLRYPSMTVLLVGIPVIFLLLFVYVFGGTLGAGLRGVAGRRAGYVNYVTPGILVVAVACVSQGTAISVAIDMTEGIIARFRTMAIWRGSVLAGHVLGSMIQAILSVAVVIGVALLVGLRPAASTVDWALAAGLIGLLSLALIWLSVGCGLVSTSVETASNLPMPLMILPFLGSGFVQTDSIPPGLRWFAEYQPFTPIMDTLRGLLIGGPIGSNGAIAVGWCVAIAGVGYTWSRSLYDRDPA